ncbi:MAG: hypothetical protein JNG86_08905, partial [Verrucomicrobiaceae bacterium]|nr:hypothetical protein [Verrucomicrobiaceae bacterium]
MSAPSPQQESPVDLEEQTSTRWMLWTFLALGAVAVLWLLYFDRAAGQMKNWWGRGYIPDITASLEKEDWTGAARSLAQATRWAPDDAEVLRV